MREKTLKMADGVVLSLKTIALPGQRVSAFCVRDVDFVCDSVLFEVFLSFGGEVCAYSLCGEGYRVKLFSPLNCT